MTTHDEYLAALPKRQRVALEALRRIIRAAATGAEECISYRLQAYRLYGKVLVLFGAAATHCAFYPGSGAAVAAHRHDLEGFSTSTGTIRFDPDTPLPAALVRMIVKYRIAENTGGTRQVKQTSARPPATRASTGTAARPRSRANRPRANAGPSAGDLITARIAALGDWRAHALRRVRQLILEADAGITEEWKWNTPVWSHHGIVCTGESYKHAVKLTFARGASLQDPARLFNASLDGNVRRAIDIREGETLDGPSFKALIRAAVAVNLSGKRK